MDSGSHASIGFPLSLALALAGIIASLVAVFALSGSASAHPLAGAIFTTFPDGSAVNANIYEDKCDVAINGGPSGPQSHHLPDGTYDVAVTDPSGRTVLGEGSGVVTVSGGEGTFGPTTLCSMLSPSPYVDTPNPGGEYKVWVCMEGQLYVNHDCKTDNFKVRAEVVTAPTPVVIPATPSVPTPTPAVIGATPTPAVIGATPTPRVVAVPTPQAPLLPTPTPVPQLGLPATPTPPPIVSAPLSPPPGVVAPAQAPPAAVAAAQAVEVPAAPVAVAGVSEAGEQLPTAGGPLGRGDTSLKLALLAGLGAMLAGGAIAARMLRRQDLEE